MLLISLSIKNYRCFEEVDRVPIDQLTAFIGPNDAGKTSVLRLLRHCFRSEPMPASDFRLQEYPVVVELGFDVTRASEAVATEGYRRSERELLVRKEFLPNQRPTTSVSRQAFVDERLNMLEGMRQQELQALMQELGVEGPCRTNDDRIAAIRQKVAETEVPTQEAWVPAGNELDTALPDYLLFGADEDLTLQSGPLVAALRQVYRSFLERESDQLSALLERATSELRNEITGLNPVLQSFAPDGLALEVEPSLDISNGLNLGEMRVRMPDGSVVGFGSCGDGTKRRIVVAVFSWANDVLKRLVDEEGRSLIWGFDEPDTHLHYEAQYRLLGQLKTMAQGHMQILLCTHSIPIIDRLPATAIRHVGREVTEGGPARRSRIDHLGDPFGDGGDVADFLQSVGRGMGFPNSLLFYERCFVLVEGPTEEKALRILYRKLHGTKMLDDGIRLFAAENDGMALQLARLLHAQRKEVIVLLDSDTRVKLATGIERLATDGLNTAERIIFAGTVEFEDCFSDAALLACLNEHHARRDGEDWSDEHIRPFRERVLNGEAIKL